MRQSQSKVGNTQNDIVKIEPIGPDQFEVYFKWLPLPVTMNRSYLATVVEDIGMVMN